MKEVIKRFIPSALKQRIHRFLWAYVRKINLKNVNLLSDIKKYSDNLYVKVRSTGKLIKAKIKIEESTAEINLEENESGVSPGQACVFYSKSKVGDKVLGGGWITKAINKYLSTQFT